MFLVIVEHDMYTRLINLQINWTCFRARGQQRKLFNKSPFVFLFLKPALRRKIQVERPSNKYMYETRNFFFPSSLEVIYIKYLLFPLMNLDLPPHGRK